MSTTRRRQIVVVKNIKESTSPKRQLLVSRKPLQTDLEEMLEPSHMGNSSPVHPIKTKDGNVLNRSILGDPAVYENIERMNIVAMQDGSGSPVLSPPRGGRTAGKSSPIHTGSHPGTAEVVRDVTEDPDLYFETLRKKKDAATKARKHDIELGETLAAYIPMEDRFSLNKEKNVLTLWQQRQKEWQRIQNRIAKTCNTPKDHSLMMQTTDEFRIKAEEYDVLQAAIPASERFGADNWEMQLRGGSTRVVTIGHIFSGLECEVKQDRKVPSIIRRPRPSSGNEKTVTISKILGSVEESSRSKVMKRSGSLMESSAALRAKKRRLKANIKTIRPHDVTMDDAEGLLVKSIPLFQWAEESSSQYFAMKNEQAMADLEAIDETATESLSEETKRLDEEQVQPEEVEMDKSQPRIAFHASTEVVFKTDVGKTTYQIVKFTNTGPIALNYNWSIDESKYPITSSAAHPSSLRQILLNRNAEKKATRESMLSMQRSSFYCQKENGKVLPGETIETCFSYCNRTGGGVINQAWLLKTVPKAHIRIEGSNHTDSKLNLEQGMNELTLSEAVNKSPSMASVCKVIETETPVCINFRGHTSIVDCALTQRVKTSNVIDSLGRDASIVDQLLVAVGRVRDPIRMNTVLSRQKSIFQTTNDAYLRSLCGIYNKSMPYYVTNERIDDFEKYYHCAVQSMSELKLELFSLVDEIISRKYFDICIEIDEEAINLQEFDSFKTRVEEQEMLDITQGLVAVQEQMFPEKELDVFDEVAIEDVTLKWSMNIEQLIKKCELNEQRAGKYVDIETMLVEYKKEEEKREKIAKKQARKEARKARKGRKGKKKQEEDSDDESDEEVEDEDDDVDDQAAAVAAALKRAKHPKIVAATKLTEECHSLVRMLFTIPPPVAMMEKAASKALVSLVDSFNDYSHKAHEVAKLAPDTAIVPFKSPFSTDEGHMQWLEVLDPTAAAELAAKAAAEAGEEPVHAGKATKGGKEDHTTPTHLYYKSLYTQVSEGLLSALTEGMFAEVDQELDSEYKKSVMASTAADLFHTSCIRPEDISDKERIVFINFDGDAFTAPTDRASATSIGDDFKQASSVVLSAYNEVHDRQQRALNALYISGVQGAHAAVLVYESAAMCPTSEIRSITKHCSAISQLLNEREANRKRTYDSLSNKKKKLVDAVVEVKFDVLPCMSAAELKVSLDQFKSSDTYKGVAKGTAIFPVFVLENIALNGVIAIEPELEDEISDDEDAPLSAFGSDAYKEHRMKLHIQKRPHRVTTNIPVISSQAIQAVNQKRLNSVGSTIAVDTFADVNASVEELMNMNTSSIWIDATVASMVQPAAGVLRDIKCSDRFVTMEIREMLLWCGVVKYCPLITALKSIEEPTPEQMTITSHFNRLFPDMVPNLLFVVGGEAKIEKFRLLDDMVDMATSIFVVGEMAIPFLCLNTDIVLNKYKHKMASYKACCLQILKRARSRGVAIVLPCDVMVGDEAVGEEKFKCYEKVDNDARDEGCDYDDEIKVLSMSGPVTTDGFIYDIGPETCKALVAAVESANFLMVWGSVGLCEVSAFQAGQRALVNASIIKVQDKEEEAVEEKTVEEKSVVPDKKASKGKKGAKEEAPAAVVTPTKIVKKPPAQTIVIGDATVEWYTRIADPEGEFNGNLPQHGLVGYCQRISCTFIGYLSGFAIPSIKNIATRTPIDDEFVFYTKEQIVEEEEEEEEDEEDDDDDDDDDDEY